LHTQSFPDTVEVLAQVCANNGGGLQWLGFTKVVLYHYTNW
jgi:hypothetical protein